MLWKKWGIVMAMSLVLTCTMPLFGCNGAIPAPPPATPTQETLGEYGTVKLAFPAISDIHFGSVVDKQVREYYPKALQKSLDDTGNRVHAVVVSGDWSEGFLKDYDTLIGYTLAGVGAETPLIASYGNHEGDGKHAQYEQKFGKKIDNVTNVNGYNFIVVGAHAGNTYTVAQANWLDEQLSMFTIAEPNKPVFVVVHHPISDTHDPIYGNPELQSTLKKYKQAFVLCGHQHQSFSEESFWKGEFISFRNSYLRNEKEGQYALIRVTDKNFVVIKLYSVKPGGEATYLEGRDFVVNLNEFYQGK